MTTLRLFNPSHEMALADHTPNFQPSKHVVLMERQLAPLPVWWSQPGDAVVVPDALTTREWARSLQQVLPLPTVEWVGWQGVPSLSIDAVEPWGWNKSVGKALAEAGLGHDAAYYDRIRALSSRQLAVEVLHSLPSSPYTVGEACYCTTEAQIDEALARYPYYVLKQLWSSSGRGVMLMQSAEVPQMRRLCSSFLRRAGGVVIEPQYDKLQDLALEFWSDGQGQVRFAGYSLFLSDYGRYAANVVAPQQALLRGLQVGEEVLNTVCRQLEQQLSERLGHAYCGALGVDMMVVRHEGTLKLHPCVEINLRRNMGWVALTLSERLLAPGTEALLYSEYRPAGALWTDHTARLREHPLQVSEDGKVKGGYLSLTPVGPDTAFRVRLEVQPVI